MKMKGYIFLMVNLAASSAFSISSNEIETVEIGEDKDLTEINKDLHDDDILELLSTQRGATTYESRRWTLPVPYVLGKTLEMNAKGVILRAFDQFRLKSCIDFKPRDSEKNYISVQKLSGCSSFVGRVQSKEQVLSIGRYCDQISTVEHEFLHALGFYHEQSRYDRDNYVTIVPENIQKGFERNFIKVSSERSTTHGVPYDYESVMHYSKNAFSNGNGSTIITKDKQFQDVIGQRLEMSPSDVLELNLLYKCNSTIAFRMNCGFSNGTMCEMNQCSQRGNSWEMVTHVDGGPSSDHTSLSSGSNENGEDSGYFMHVSTSSGKKGDSAWLETKMISPKRGCHVQCLQFYYYHSGSESDVLNIWIREFKDEQDYKGTLRLMGQITGPQTSHWKLHHVSLNAMKHFQVEFEVRKGKGSSSGGFSIDDINLSELECPHLTLQIDNFEELLYTSKRGSFIYSPRQYSMEGYAYRVAIRLYGTYIGMYMQLLSGDYDDKLEWPCPQRQMTFQMLDQNPKVQLQMSKQRSITSDATLTSSSGTFYWDNPRNIGTQIKDENNELMFAGPLMGRSYFASLEEMKSRDFLKGESAIFVFNFQDLTPLVNGSALPCPQARPVRITHPPTNQDEGPCSSRIVTTTLPPPKTTDDSILTSTPSPPKTTDDRIVTTTLPPPKTTDDSILTSTPPPPKTTDDRIVTTTLPPPKTTDDSILTSTPSPPKTTDDRIVTTTLPPPKTTDDDSIFGFSPGMMASPVFILLLALMVLLP